MVCEDGELNIVPRGEAWGERGNDERIEVDDPAKAVIGDEESGRLGKAVGSFVLEASVPRDGVAEADEEALD